MSGRGAMINLFYTEPFVRYVRLRPQSALMRILIAAVCYYLSAWLNLSLTTPFGYATPVWIPAGIAVGFSLFWSWPGLIGVGLGAAINIGVQLHSLTPAGSWSAASWASLPILTSGVVLQAFVISAFLSRFMQLHHWPLGNNRLLGLLLIAGPLGCLVSATLSTGSLYLLDQLYYSDLWNTWLQWWVGDALGVLVAFPLMGLWLFKPPFKSFRYSQVTLPLLLVLAVMVTAHIWLGVVDKQSMRQQLESRITEATRSLHFSLQGMMNEVEVFPQLFEFNKRMKLSEFRQFALSSLARSGLSYISWVPEVSEEDKNSFERAQKSWDEDYRIQPPAGEKSELGDAAEYSPLQYVAPSFSGLVPGTNFAQIPAINDVINQARVTRRVILSPPITLPTGQKGFVLASSAYSSRTFTAEGSRKFVGTVIGMVELDRLQTLLYEESIRRDLQLRLIYRGPVPQTLMQIGDFANSDGLKAVQQLSFANQNWVLEGMFVPGFYQGGLSLPGQILLIGSLIVTIFTVLVVLSTTSQQALVARQVASRTAALDAEVRHRRRIEGALRESAEHAERASQAKDDFLVTMSHEIRTPLNGLLGMLELMPERNLDDGQLQTLQVARQSGQHMVRIINDILDYSKMEAGKLHLSVAPMSLLSVMQHSVDTYRMLASSKGLRIQWYSDEESRRFVMGDSVRLEQVLTNFISNAIKFTEHGEVEVSAVSRVEREGYLSISLTVRDTGIGIEQEVQKRLFSPFIQASADTSRLYGGTGLGLSICRRLTELMGGHLVLHSSKGVGTRITLNLELPLAMERLATTKAQPASALPPMLVGMQVLVVDDNATNRMLLKGQLKRLGAEVLSAEDGEQALRCWQSHQESLGLIITDCHMPVMDGYTLCARVRESQGELPIIGWTANAMGNERDLCLQAGMNEVLFKPTNMAQLSTALKPFVPHERQARPEPGKSRRDFD
ncbi:ATP-binding protein [Pokkaliibacter sp. CJK22405]|uniref:ATP-binding protein n=1 Tax=Pokkaliibacter sp. CJK22405 TaxID=3384615 RepID=UPI003984AD24